MRDSFHPSLQSATGHAPSESLGSALMHALHKHNMYQSMMVSGVYYLCVAVLGAETRFQKTKFWELTPQAAREVPFYSTTHRWQRCPRWFPPTLLHIDILTHHSSRKFGGVARLDPDLNTPFFCKAPFPLYRISLLAPNVFFPDGRLAQRKQQNHRCVCYKP